MKSRFTGLAALLAATLTLFSCQGTGPSGESDVIPVMKVPRETEAAAGGSQFVKVAAVGQWTMSVDYIDGDGWIHLNKTTDSGNASVDMTIDPNDAETPRKATLVLKTSNHEVSKEITQMGKVTAATSGWLELPAFEQDNNIHFLVHDNIGGAYKDRESSGVRNWSCLYDYSEYLSYWVAYPLNNSLIGTGSRTNEWGLDPLVPKANQVVLLLADGGYGGGYSRGHQIPSADRLNRAANVSTFYMTNMTPQRYNFNGGVWGRLENQVRSWASSSDTLYVVTGCDIRNYKGYTGNSGGHKVKIPDHFYKALLRRKGKSYSAIGFYLEHQLESALTDGNYMDDICSISELESLTGIDFFVNLPALLGADKARAIEEASPSETLKNW